MFTVALFITAKKEKQNICPPTDKWIDKMWPSHTMDYYSPTKRNKTPTQATT